MALAVIDQSPGLKLFRWHGPGNEVTLGIVAAQAGQWVPVSLGFDAFGHGFTLLEWVDLKRGVRPSLGECCAWADGLVPKGMPQGSAKTACWRHDLCERAAPFLRVQQKAIAVGFCLLVGFMFVSIFLDFQIERLVS